MRFSYTVSRKGCFVMNSFLKGMLLGVGIGLLIAPMKGDEMRNMLSERANEVRGYLPENEQIDIYRQRVSDRVSQTTGTLKGYAQQAASSVKQTASNLNSLAQNATSNVKGTSQDVVDMTRDTVKSTSNDIR
ncbi:MAG: YtxH domain-containing protein [Chloroflexi bacterium]|nr:MAG: YtxH domain-containing protein [Chloroflexota bacterium]